MAEEKTPSLFQKFRVATDSWLEAVIQKNNLLAKSNKSNKDDEEDVLFYRLSLDKDNNEYEGSHGYYEKKRALSFDHQTHMMRKDSVVASIVLTRQNQIAGFSSFVKNKFDRGAQIRLKNEPLVLDYVSKMLREGMSDEEIIAHLQESLYDKEDNYISLPKRLDKTLKEFNLKKSSKFTLDKTPTTTTRNNTPEAEGDITTQEEYYEEEKLKEHWMIKRKARLLVKTATSSRKHYLEAFITNCGVTEGRPFETKRWTFSSINRALMLDSLVHDQMCIEIIRNEAGDPHHFVPVDAATIRFSSDELKKYKDQPFETKVDIFDSNNPVKTEAIYRKDFELDESKLEKNEYKYVQIINNVIERAFLDSELKLGIRNPTTDIYSNGYGVSELELLVSLVSSHLNTENYNISYFSQGFSAKGILHIKNAMGYRKLETFRQQWRTMISGSRNSFQTPILAGAEEVNWIPLTQNHSDIEFRGWLQYLIKMICAIYQIDPQEIGLGMKDEGGSGGISGDNTAEKISLSKDKGLYPLLTFLANFYNTNIIDEIDQDFELTFVGLRDETIKDALERQKRESEFKKTVNEIREEDDLDPLPGMNEFILSAVFFQWYQQFSSSARDQREDRQQALLAQNLLTYEQEGDNLEAKPLEEKVVKALKVEFYQLPKED